MTSWIYTLQDCHGTGDVGGKGANLGKLVRAGFHVPEGFVIGTAAYRAAQTDEGIPATIPAELAEAIIAAYWKMGSPAVAVRSSATAEDMAAASMAGQYETYLDVKGEEDLLEKVRQCWASLDSPRIRAYLAEHGIDRTRVAMAVVVQRLVPADVAGVLFTANPNGSPKEMLIEASWGLGESVVSGRVQPDTLRLEAASGRLLQQVIADKRTELAAGSHAEREVEESRRKIACLGEREIAALWDLGRRAAKHFGVPQDLEWAIERSTEGSRVYLLQSRPITTHEEMAAGEAVLEETRKTLAEKLATGHGPWVLHNLAETLTHPTPLTWSVIRRFMSGSGGYGNMYRQAGFEPSPEARARGFLELIGGRIYMDAAMAPEMFFENFPFAYDVEELKHSPDASQTPPTLPRGTLRRRMQAGRRLAGVQAKLKKMAEELDADLRENAFPALEEYVAAARQKNLAALSVAELIALWKQHEKRALDEFAPLSLLPSMICGMVLGELKAFLQEHLWEEDAEALAQLFSAGGLANRTVIADAELHDVASGHHKVEEWLSLHGHRAAGEFDLASPRWRERPAELMEMGRRLVTGERPLERHRRTSEEVNRRVAEIRRRLPADLAAEFDRRLEMVRRYMPFREDGKDYFMLGYDLLRDLALEAGRRLEIGDDVFFLTRDELFAALETRNVPADLVAQRKLTHRAEERLTLPHVIDQAAVAAGFRPAEAAGEPAAGARRGFAVSGGRARGRARILRSPDEAGELEPGYILVCPSTDPSWTPLFVNAAGLILECGGTLSHGAVVAREMGLPAVVIADATRLFQDGDEIVVDGTAGWAGSAADMSGAQAAADPSDTRIAPALLPPAPGPRDRKAARLRNRFAAAWTIFLLAFFLLPPAWVYSPTLAILDNLLWPFARLSKPGCVVVVAVVISVVTLVLQKCLTDNRRLVEAKRRAGVLTKEADGLPAGSPRKRVLQQVAAGVQTRSLLAALVPVGILLGPMVMPFLWFKERIDPAVVHAPAGATVQVVAMVDPNVAGPVRVSVPAEVEVDALTPVSQTLPPIEPTLQRLLAQYRANQQTWEVSAGPKMPPQEAAASLEAYLKKGIPPQPVRWQLRTQKDHNGKFAVEVTAGGGTPVAASVVVGDRFAPAPLTVAGSGTDVREIRLVYPMAGVEPFWRPFKWLGMGRLSAWDAGWVWLYIVAYLPVLFVTRWLLRVA